MPRRLIHQTFLKDHRLRKLGGLDMIGAFPRLAELIKTRLAEANLKFLARPQLDKAAGRIDWYVDLPGPARPFASLSLTEQGAVLTSLSRFQEQVTALAEALKKSPSAASASSPDSAGFRASGASAGPPASPAASGSAPSGLSDFPLSEWLSHLFDDLDQGAFYLVGHQPVMAGWGLTSEQAAELPEPLPAPAWPAAVPAAPVSPRKPGCLAALGLFFLALLLSGLAGFLILRFSRPEVWQIITGRRPLPAIDQQSFDRQNEEAGRLNRELARLKRDYEAKKNQCRPPEPAAPPEEPAPPPPKAKPAPAKPKEASKPKLEQLVIPKDAVQNNDLSFLEGCWKSVTGLRNNSGEAIITEYCFDKKGRGTSRTIELSRRGGIKQVCPSKARANFEGRQLVIREEPNICPDGRRYSPTVIECARTESAASCEGVNLNNGRPGKKWSARLERTK